MGIIAIFGFSCIDDASGDSESVDCRYVGGYGGSFQDVGFYDDYLLATHYRGMSVFNVSDPSSPTLISHVPTNGAAKGLDVKDDLAYISEGFDGFEIINVSDPENPMIDGRIIDIGDAYEVVVDGNLAYIASGYNGLVILNISDGKNPISIGHYDTEDARDVAVSDGFAYIADRNTGIYVIDVSSPESPVLAGKNEDIDLAQGITVRDNIAYVAADDFTVMDVFVKSNPRVVGSTRDTLIDIEVKGNYAYGVGGSFGYGYYYVFDVSNPTDPKEVGTFNNEGGMNSITFIDDYSVITDGGSGTSGEGFLVLNISDPTSPTKVGEYNCTPSSANGIFLDENTAYVTNGYHGLVIFDVSDVSNPIFLAKNDTASYAQDVVVKNNYAYVADGLEGLAIFDVSTPGNPIWISQYDTDGYVKEIDVQNSEAYLADTRGGLTILDVSDPRNPKLMATIDTDGDVNTLVVHGNFVFLGDAEDSGDGLIIINVSDPSNPRVEGKNGEVRKPWDMEVVDDILFVAEYDYAWDGKSGLVVFNVSDPTNPHMVKYFGIPGSENGIAISDSYAILANHRDGLQIIDISDLQNMTIVGNYDTDNALNVIVQNGIILVADHYNGFEIAQFVPHAILGEMTPTSAFDTDIIEFSGFGTCRKDVEIIQYSWSSSIDGVIHTGTIANFSSSGLSVGNHTISFQVQNSEGTWSNSNITSILIKQRAMITTVFPNPGMDNDEVEFSGSVYNNDTISRYVWKSSLDGEIHNSTLEANFSKEGLSVGNHTILFVVQDKNGIWSNKVSVSLLINEFIQPNRIPHVEITSPLNNSVILGTIIIQGNATDPDGFIQNVEISINGSAWVIVTGVENWNYQWDTKEAGNGLFDVRVRAFDGEIYSDVAYLKLNLMNEDNSNEGDGDGIIPGFEPIVLILSMSLICVSKWNRKHS